MVPSATTGEGVIGTSLFTTTMGTSALVEPSEALSEPAAGSALAAVAGTAVAAPTTAGATGTTSADSADSADRRPTS